MSKKYSLKEAFYTVQGEGYHAGTPAFFIRFSGCNMWSGNVAHRVRDAKRNNAECPLWCDTDFEKGTPTPLSSMPAMFERLGLGDDVPLIVLTGGEPLLQVDEPFIGMLREIAPQAEIAVETNGTVVPKVPVGTWSGIDWVCVSPKLSVDRLKLTHGHELKVVLPAYNPLAYDSIRENFEHAYVSAEATTSAVGRSIINSTNLQRAAKFVMAHPEWKLTLQSHKIIGVQ